MAMATVRSTSGESSSSSITTTTMSHDRGQYQTSAELYDDREHHQAIFSNDSRFFDTSLHLFRCYRDMGYVKQANKSKAGYLLSSSSSNLSSNERKDRWRGPFRLFSNNLSGKQNRSFKMPLTPTLRRSRDDLKGPRPSNEIVSSLVTRPKTLITNPDKSPVVVQYKLKPEPTEDDDDSQDEPEISVTRL